MFEIVTKHLRKTF